jgi:uncharacterized protein GlcG (DUF336 family)
MRWLDILRHRRRSQGESRPALRARETPLTLERLEDRTMLNGATAVLSNGLLSISGGPGNDYLTLLKDPRNQTLFLLDGGREVARFASAAVGQIQITVSNNFNVVRVGNDIVQPTTMQGGTGTNIFYGGGGQSVLVGGIGAGNKLVAGSGQTALLAGANGANQLFSGPAANTLVGANSTDLLYNVKVTDTSSGLPGDPIVSIPGPAAPDTETLSASDVGTLLSRAAAASASNDAIIAIVDRNGTILGVRVESGVSQNIVGSQTMLTYAVDGAVSLARTGAFFASDQAPLTSRTVQDISQSTITQREVNSNPDVFSNPLLYGPGFVAPIGTRGHFPANINDTPQVDLFEIEHTNRDTINHPGPSGIPGGPDEILLPSRFNVPTQFLAPGVIPGVNYVAPNSYGFTVFGNTAAQPRGIATLPGGIPIYKNGELVGGIGVFFPGQTGSAQEENSALSSTFDPSKPDRAQEAEFIAYSAVGGAPASGFGVPTVAGIGLPPGITGLPFGRIDLVGIQLDIFGPDGRMGPQFLASLASTYGTGNPNDGVNIPVTSTGTLLLSGNPVASGLLVVPHDGVEPGVHLTGQDVQQVINQAVSESFLIHAAIRLPIGVAAKYVIAVADTQGNVLGLFREQDATVFSINVAVSKARDQAYYANPAQLQPIDMVPGVPAGAAFSPRTFRFLSLPRLPEGINAQPPGPFSQLNDGGSDLVSGTQVGPTLPASAFQSVVGHDSFNPQTTFHSPFNIANQSGIVFFPGGTPLYKTGPNGQPVLVGALGISGDGVTQDDVDTFEAAQGFGPPVNLQADQFFFRGLRLPFIQFDRNPEG